MLTIAGGIILGFLGVVLIVRGLCRHQLRKIDREKDLPRGILFATSERQIDALMQAANEAEAKAQAKAEMKAKAQPIEPMSVGRILVILFFFGGWAFLISLFVLRTCRCSFAQR